MVSARYISKAEAARVLRRAGVPDDRVNELLKDLSDPIDIDRDSAFFVQHGITLDRLNDLMGGSP